MKLGRDEKRAAPGQFRLNAVLMEQMLAFLLFPHSESPMLSKGRPR
jgi:hypothetical protein